MTDLWVSAITRVDCPNKIIYIFIFMLQEKTAQTSWRQIDVISMWWNIFVFMKCNCLTSWSEMYGMRNTHDSLVSWINVEEISLQPQYSFMTLRTLTAFSNSKITNKCEIILNTKTKLGSHGNSASFSCLRLFPHLLVKVQNSFWCMCWRRMFCFSYHNPWETNLKSILFKVVLIWKPCWSWRKRSISVTKIKTCKPIY